MSFARGAVGPAWLLVAAACGPAAAPRPQPIELSLPPQAAQPDPSSGPDEPPDACPPLEPPSRFRGEPVAEVPISPDDPRRGVFGLAEATRDLPGAGPLLAKIGTDRGEIACELWPDRAPITVANFVGLARGRRPWKDPSGQWRTSRPAYDGTTFHRIIKGFMIQGGDPKGNGSGEPGYVIPDEIWEGARHDTRGMLCMANRGKNTNGMQFFILDAATPHLDGGYTIFGQCGPEGVLDAIAGAPVHGGASAPEQPVRIHHVRIQRRHPDAPCGR